MTAALSARVEALEALVVELVEAVLNPSPPIQCVSAMLIQAKDDFVALRAAPPPPADPPDLERKEQLSRWHATFKSLLSAFYIHATRADTGQRFNPQHAGPGSLLGDARDQLAEMARLLGSAADAE